MLSRNDANRVPDYRLYRERSGEAADFWLHCESIPLRTRLHRYEIAAHRHPALFQMFHVTAGSGEVFDGGAHIGFAAPCVLFIPAGAVHGFRFAQDVDGAVVTALGDRLAGLVAADRQVAEFAERVRVVGIGAAGGEMLGRLAAEIAGRQPARATALEALVALAVIDLARVWGAGRAGEAEAPTPEAQRLELLETLVATHFRDGKPVEFYARRIGVSPAHLNRLARAATGSTVQGLVAARILEAARRDLVFTPTPINRIAESLGFPDPAYFNRFFRRQTGMTPGAFRAMERARPA